MARVTGPLMSIDASGSLAGAIVFSKWRGRNYVRRHAIPSNPRTAGQLSARSIVGFLAPEWDGLDPGDQATWEELAAASNVCPFNAYIARNARNWRDELYPSQANPAARLIDAGDVTAVVAVVTGRQVQLTCAVTPGAGDWGLMIMRSLASPVSPVPTSCVVMVPSTGDGQVVMDGPLDPGTYYYSARLVSTDGGIGDPAPEETAVVA